MNILRFFAMAHDCHDEADRTLDDIRVNLRVAEELEQALIDFVGPVSRSALASDFALACA